jgi:transposase InsO family protein
VWQRLDNSGGYPPWTSDEGSVGQGARRSRLRDQRAVLTQCKTRSDDQNVNLYSRFIVGWAISAVNDRHLTIKALEMAPKRRCPGAGLLHHSDQGCTYTSEDYQTMLDARDVRLHRGVREPDEILGRDTQPRPRPDGL